MTEWHEHHEARWLILAAQVHDLPGLSETARMRLYQASEDYQRRSEQRRLRSSDEWWPPNVAALVRVHDARHRLKSTPGIGAATMSSLTAALERLGLSWGMKYGGEGWRDHWHPDFVAQRAKGIRIEGDENVPAEGSSSS